jgi:hypothetical protein
MILSPAKPLPYFYQYNMTIDSKQLAQDHQNAQLKGLP